MSIKVLVADDSITIQKVIGIIFGGDDYSLTVVDNGKAAVDKAREIIPDILLIDALMPGMTGYEVAEAVRATPAIAAKPILILTGSFEPFDEEKARKCGADDYIAKPFESQQIIAKVKELLELGASRGAAPAAVQPQAAPEVSAPAAVDVPAPSFDIPAPVIEPQVEVPRTEAPPADIWGAFTPETEPPAAPVAAPAPAVSAPVSEPDVFAIVSEEEEASLGQSAVTAEVSQQQTGSQWIPVEENTFEFEEESIAQPPQATFADQPVPVQEASFGDIAFDDAPEPAAFTAEPEPAPAAAFQETAVPAASFADFTAPVPEFEVPAAPAEPFAPLADPVTVFSAPVPESAPAPSVAAAEPAAAATPAALTEEQLKAALASVSKDVIERIVWEVVPDLAEALIREAIRKIKEGV